MVRGSCGQPERGHRAFFFLVVFDFRLLSGQGLIEVKRLYTHEESTFREHGVPLFVFRLFLLAFSPPLLLVVGGTEEQQQSY